MELIERECLAKGCTNTFGVQKESNDYHCSIYCMKKDGKIIGRKKSAISYRNAKRKYDKNKEYKSDNFSSFY